MALLVIAVLIARAQHEKFRSKRSAQFPQVLLEAHYPDHARLGHVDSETGFQEVLDEEGERVGFVFQTSPLADDVLGYSGPTNTAVCLDREGVVLTAEIVWSEDTIDHVEKVEQAEAFWQSLQGIELGEKLDYQIDAVSGATLTSRAIASTVLERLGTSGIPSLFPEPVTIAEIAELVPNATEFREVGQGRWPLLDADQNPVGTLLRSSPSLDAFIGYQGPLDLLVAVAPDDRTVLGIRLRSTYDNEPYVSYIRDDEDYLKLFDAWELGRVASVNFDEEGIEGVSGATVTSWAIAEATKRRIAEYLVNSEMNEEDTSLVASVGLHDMGMFAMVAFACLLSFTRLRGKKYLRVLWQLTVVIYIGFITGNLVSQALLAGWAKAGIAWQSSAGLALTGVAALIVPWSTGHQLYCHHLCPHGILQQWTLKLRQKMKWKAFVLPKKVERVLLLVPWLLLLTTMVVLFVNLPLNLADLEPFDAWVLGVSGGISLLIAVVGLIASLFYPMAYCRFGCPTGALLGFLRSRGKMDAFGLREAIAVMCLSAGILTTQLF